MVTYRLDPSHGNNSTRLRAVSAGLPGCLSIVIPARDEAANLSVLIEEVVNAIRPLMETRSNKPILYSFELIIIDDGSMDQSPELLNKLSLQFPELNALRIDQSVGQSAAIMAGILEARSEWIGMLDADLQNNPADLARLWDALPGYDAALGWRVKRQDTWTKRIISRSANAVRNRFFKQKIKDTGCSVRIFRRDNALRFPAFRGMHRFFGPLLLRDGCRIVQVPVSHRPRASGKSHYTVWNRSLAVIIDLFGVAWLMRRPICCQAVRLTQQTTPQAHFRLLSAKNTMFSKEITDSAK